MAEKTITKESEKSEQTDSDEALRLQEVAEYCALPVREQQMEQLQGFIKMTYEGDFDWSDGEYMSYAGAFFSVEVQVMLHGILGDYMHEDYQLAQEGKDALRLLLELCQIHPERMLSGEYPLGRIIVQEPIA
jgi:hypothetical protein